MSDPAVALRHPVTPEIPGPVALEEAKGVPSALQFTSSKQIAPADQVAIPRWWERLAWYVGSVLLSCILIFCGLRLDDADLRAPFYYDLDSLLILPMVKSTVERGPGGHWRNERMGAPGILELYDYPVIDHLHFLLIWMLSKLVTNLFVLYNLYFLLTFPLTTFTAMVAFRHLRLTLPAAAVGGLLYSFLPYHYQRWENHYFLAAYWLVPLSLLPVLAICKGDFPFFHKLPDGCYRRRLVSWGSAWLVLLGTAIASGGAYYAFFTCAFLAFAGLYGTAVFRKWQSAASAAGIIAIVVVFGIVNHFPTYVYQAEYGWNPVTDRLPEEADTYGLKIAHLILPIEDHNLVFLARIKRFYNSPIRPSENENKAASLGMVGVAGFLGLMVSLLLSSRMGWPYKPLAILTLFGVLLGTVGGLGSLFNLLVMAQIRGYNRISVFIAFLCMFATLWAIDRFLVERRRSMRVLYMSYALLPPVWLLLFPCREISPHWREQIDRLRDRLRPRTVSATYYVWGAVLLVGLFDQTPSSWFQSGIIQTLEEQANRFRADAQFFAEIERTLSPGAKVFCLPYVPFPESQPVLRVAAYEHSRGYIHTDTLVWSFGAIKGRETDAWQQEVSFRVTEELLERIVYRGFDGLLIDTRGFPTLTENKGFRLINEINRIYANIINKRNAMLPEIVHEDGQQLFLDLRPYREGLRSVSPSLFDAKVQEEREWAAVIWLGRFYAPGMPGDEGYLRFCPPDAYAWIINPTDRTRKFDLTMTFSPLSAGSFRMRLIGLVDDDFNLERKSADWNYKKDGVEKHYQFELPPGRHSIRIRCTPPAGFIPNDNREFCYSIKDFKFKEIR